MLSRLRPATSIIHCVNKTSLPRAVVCPVTQSAIQCMKRAATVGPVNIGKKSEAVFQKEKTFGAENYAPIPVAVSKGEGKIWKSGYDV